jgi:hypothetical protein
MTSGRSKEIFAAMVLEDQATLSEREHSSKTIIDPEI